MDNQNSKNHIRKHGVADMLSDINPPLRDDGLYQIYGTLPDSQHLRLSARHSRQCSTSSSHSPQGSCTSETRYKDLPAGSLRSETLVSSLLILFPPSPLLHLSRFWMLLLPLSVFQRRLFRRTPPRASSPLNVSNASRQPLPRPFPAISLLLS